MRGSFLVKCVANCSPRKATWKFTCAFTQERCHMDVMYVANDLTLAGIEKSTISHIWRSKHEHLFVMLHLIETFICYATFDRTIWLLSYIWLKNLLSHIWLIIHLLSYIWLKLLFCWATFDWNIYFVELHLIETFILLSYIWLKHLFCWATFDWNIYFVELHLI